MKLVEGLTLRKAWAMYSVKALAAIGLIQSVLFVVPTDRLMKLIPYTTWTWADLGFACTVVTAGIGGIGKFIDQGIMTPPATAPAPSNGTPDTPPG